MTTVPTRAASADASADALIASFERAGYARVAPAILQPAEPFLDLSGEDIRKRMFLTSDPHGQELCLRPDLTIPVSRDYLASPAAGKPQGYCYLGPVFRHRDEGPSEILQAGIESFGRADTAAADAEMLALALEATSHYGLAQPDIRTGDVGLFAALIGALELAPPWKRRLMKDFNRKSNLAHDLERLAVIAAQERPEYQGVLAALAGSDPKGAHALVTDLLSIAGISTVGGRTVGEIADRFLEQAALGSRLGPAARGRRADQALSRHRRRSRRGRGRAAHARRRRQDRARPGARSVREPHRVSGGARRRRLAHPLRHRLRPRLRLLHRLRVRAAWSERKRQRPAGRGRTLRRAADAARQRRADPGRRLRRRDRAARGRAGRRMSAPFIIAVPSKGRLHDNALAFFARAGLEFVKPRGERDYRGTIAGIPGVEVAYLSSSEIADLLAQGAVHFGLTGEDLIREKIVDADRRVVFVDQLGFGHANVVVAVPQAWIDVHAMADLDDVATAFRLKHGRKMRLATKYVNLTRGFFSGHGVTDYRIVESSGATEAAPAAGTAELIVDITTTGATLAANGLRVIDDGVILRSQANLVAARGATWGAAERSIARTVLDRIAARGARAASSARCARALPAATTRCSRKRANVSASPRRSAARPRPAC